LSISTVLEMPTTSCRFGPEGFTFYTNYGSRKAGELDSNPRAALVFYWEPLKRSVRVEGTVSRVPEEESDEYFHTRPLGSQIGACVSNQSRVVAGREVLVAREEALAARHGSGEVPVARPNWGGYRVEARSVEFWRGQSTRIHDRIRFRREEEGEEVAEASRGDQGWVMERLEP